MALGNTPKRLTNIYLERSKSFVLNVRFKYYEGEAFDLTDHVLRLSADAPPRYGGDQILTLVADHVDSVGGHAQFKFQAEDLSLEPAEYAYDVTILSPKDFTTPVIKGLLVIGSNTEEINDNVFTENLHTDDEVLVLFGDSCDVEIRFDKIELIVGPQGKQGFQGPPTGVFIQPDEPSDPTALPPFFPLWVDSDEDVPLPGTGGGSVVIVAPEPPDPTGLAEGTQWVDEDSEVPPHISVLLGIQDEGANMFTRPYINFIGAGVTTTDDAVNNRTNITIPGGGSGGGGNSTVIVAPEPPATAGLPEGALWVDEDSEVPPLGGGLQTRTTATTTTASLAAGASESGTIALAAGYRLYRITTSAPARVRLHTTTAKQFSDASRPIGTDPTGDHGCVLEFVSTSGLLAADLSPLVDGFDGKATPDGAIPYHITNTGTGAAAITVTFNWIRSE